jgi:hypothetical protein
MIFDTFCCAFLMSNKSAFIVLLKSDLNVQQSALLNKSIGLLLPLGVTKFLKIIAVNLVTLCYAV